MVFRNQARGTENKGRKEFVNVSHQIVRLVHRIADGPSPGSTPFRLPQAFHGKQRAALLEYHVLSG